MILSDKDLKICLSEGRVRISPYNAELIGPSGIDIRLGDQIRVFKDLSEIYETNPVINPFNDTGEAITELIEPRNGRFIIQPGELILANSLERIELPDDLVARLIPRNSFNRIGLFLLSSSGTIEPGFKGHLTLAIENIGKIPIILYPGMSFCKLAFEAMSSCAEIPYGKRNKPKYQEQSKPGENRLYLEKSLII